MALAVRRSASAGGADATIASAANWMTNMDAVLIAAGWTAHDTLSASDIVYKSTGENTHRATFLRVFANSNSDWGTYMYQYWDAATHIGYNGVSPTSFRQTSFTAGTYQHVFVADLDSYSWSMWQGSSGYFGGGGWFDPPAMTSMDAVDTTAAMAPGDNVEVKVGADPATRGIEVSQTVTIVAQEAATPPIPLFCTTVTATRFDGTFYYITLRRVPASLAAGAIVGQAPHHVYNLGMRTMGGGMSVTFALTGFVPGMPNQDLNMYSAIGGTPSNGYSSNFTDRTIVGRSVLNAEWDPDGRTGRVYIDPFHITHSLVGKSVHLGAIGKLYRSPVAGDAQWKLYRTPKASTPRDWIVTLLSTTRHIHGPIPTSGSVTAFAELFPLDGVAGVYANDPLIDAADAADQPIDSSAIAAQVDGFKESDTYFVLAAPEPDRTGLRNLQHTPTVAGEIANEPFFNDKTGYTFVSAVVTGDKTLRMKFNSELRHVSSAGQNDSLNPANYFLSGDRAIVSLTWISYQDGLTTIDMVVDKEWVIGQTYTIRVRSVMSPNDLPIDLFQNHDLQTFLGAATRPTIVVATAGEQRVDVTLSEDMNLATLVPAGFTVAPNGGSGVAVSVIGVTVVNSSQVRLALNKRMTNGQPYRLTLNTSAQDAVGNAAAASTTFDFTGFAAPANVLNVVFLDSSHIRVVFDVDVTNNAALQNPASYTGSNGLLILAVVVEGPRSVVLTTNTLQHGISYTLTV